MSVAVHKCLHFFTPLIKVTCQLQEGVETISTCQELSMGLCLCVLQEAEHDWVSSTHWFQNREKTSRKHCYWLWIHITSDCWILKLCIDTLKCFKGFNSAKKKWLLVRKILAQHTAILKLSIQMASRILYIFWKFQQNQEIFEIKILSVTIVTKKKKKVVFGDPRAKFL